LDQPQRLWILTTEYEPHIIGGLGTAVTNLSKAYAQNGVHVTVLCRNKGARVNTETRKRLFIVRFPAKSPYFSAKRQQFQPSAIEKWIGRRAIRQPDGIHIHSVPFSDVALHFQAKRRIPVVYTSHSLVALENGPAHREKRMVAAQQALLLKKADLVTVPSRPERAKLYKMYPYCRGKTAVVYHGIVLSKSVSRASRHHLLYVGRLVPQKGIEQLLKAVSILIKEGTRVRLDVAGTGAKAYVLHLKRLARKLGISSQVRWLGYRKPNEVRHLYATRGAVVMPSLEESFGLVALEALASGIPLVSTRSGGLADVVNAAVAQTIPHPSGAAIARSIRAMLNNKRLTDKRVAAGRLLASRYPWSRSAHLYMKLFRQLQSRNAAGKKGRS
jgi:Glycosyltransferase